MPVIFLYNFEAAIFRSTGDTRTPLLALALSGVLNVILNLVFVVIFKMSVNGVAIATVIANIVSSTILLVKLTRTKQWIHLDVRELKIDGKCLSRILKIGLPAGIQSAVFNLANLVIQAGINSLGTVVIAAILTIIGVCGIRIAWVYTAFPQNRTFHTLLMAYPISLSVTALLILITLLVYHPARRFGKK